MLTRSGALRHGVRVTVVCLLATCVGSAAGLRPVATTVPTGVATASSLQSGFAIVAPSPSPPELDVLRTNTGLVDRTAARPPAPAVVTDAGILIDIDARTVLWEHNADQPRAPASTTKLMSALVALDNFALDRPVTVTANAANRDPVETQMGLAPGQTLTVGELLTGMLVVSANDAALALAEGTVGVDRFVAAMNAEAEALGLQGTYFANPSGFPDAPDQVSSARDLATVMMVLWDNYPTFRELTGIHDTVLPPTTGHPAFALHNILSRVFDVYPPVVGAKSGFTDAAGPCLVALAVRDNHHLVAVLLNARSMVDEDRSLFEWGFSQEGVRPLPSPGPTPSPAGRR